MEGYQVRSQLSHFKITKWIKMDHNIVVNYVNVVEAITRFIVLGTKLEFGMMPVSDNMETIINQMGADVTPVDPG